MPREEGRGGGQKVSLENIHIHPRTFFFAPPLPVRLLLGGNSALVAKATVLTPPASLLLQDVPFMSLLVFVRLFLSRVENATINSRLFLSGILDLDIVEKHTLATGASGTPPMAAWTVLQLYFASF